jgi:hypothetical protein
VQQQLNQLFIGRLGSYFIDVDTSTLCVLYVWKFIFGKFCCKTWKTLILVNGAWNCSKHEQFQVVLSKTDMQVWMPGVGDNILSFLPTSLSLQMHALWF